MIKPPAETNRQAPARTLDDSDSDESDNIDFIIDSAPNQRVQAPSQPTAPKQRVRKEKDKNDHSYIESTPAELTTTYIKALSKRLNTKFVEKTDDDGVEKVIVQLLRHKQSEKICYKHWDISKHLVWPIDEVDNKYINA